MRRRMKLQEGGCRIAGTSCHFARLRSLDDLGAAYAIPVLSVPALMITHVAAIYLLMRPQHKTARTLGREAAAQIGLSSRETIMMKP